MRIFLGFLLVVAGCAVNLGSAEGIVVDSTTGKGLAGAFVVSSWYSYGADMVGSRTRCVDVAVVRADADGRYRLPLAPFGLGLDRHVFAYVPIYEDDRSFGYDEIRMAQQPFSGGNEARLAQFQRFGSLLDCGKANEVSRKLGPLYLALDAEIARMEFVIPPRFVPNYTKILEQMEAAIRAKALKPG